MFDRGDDVGTNDNGGNDVGGNDPSVGEGVDKPTQTKKTRGKKTPKNAPKKAPKKAQPKPKSIVNLPPSLVSPKTTFESLTVRRSPRFYPVQNTTATDPSETTIQSHHSVFLRKIPKTTAKKKGLSTTSQPFEVDHETEGNNHTKNEVDFVDEDSSEGKKVDEPSAGSKNVKRKVDFGDEYVSEDDSDGGIMGHDYLLATNTVSMASTHDITQAMNNVTLEDEEEGGIAIEESDEVEEMEYLQGLDIHLCLTNLVGSRWLRDGSMEEDGGRKTASMNSGGTQSDGQPIPYNQPAKAHGDNQGDTSNRDKDRSGKNLFLNKGDNSAGLNISNPMKKGVVIMDNKKRRTGDGPNQHHGLGENTELCLGSDEESIDGMDQDQNKISIATDDPKNVFVAGSGTGVRQSL
ncbi:hypothetical protein POM88_018909 [Heracleum sosnowskyi]|uniref:Uncharacterized protein n=1 Tax=Heracleum sosnowskyi TaxID=360622 RepID=A0AAD8ITU5_9APIA|nr:hypothetical protein POM88_018909 [Heracleum sosnowskyi]